MRAGAARRTLRHHQFQLPEEFTVRARTVGRLIRAAGSPDKPQQISRDSGRYDVFDRPHFPPMSAPCAGLKASLRDHVPMLLVPHVNLTARPRPLTPGQPVVMRDVKGAHKPPPALLLPVMGLETSCPSLSVSAC